VQKENQIIIDTIKQWAEKEPNKQIIALSVKRINKEGKYSNVKETNIVIDSAIPKIITTYIRN
jgi:hypothetical protein